MQSRRGLLGAVAGAGAAMTSLAAGSSSLVTAPEVVRSPEGTWLTYAVNVEMTWGKLPFVDRLRKVKEAGFTHYEFWPWRDKDIDAIVALNGELGLAAVQFSASPVKGFGHGITNPDPARRAEFEEENQLADHPGRHEPTTGEINYPFVLKTIHETGYREPIGMEMSPKSDPMEAFKAIRQVDALAREIKG
jgi:hydroxypyruvate isomerase